MRPIQVIYASQERHFCKEEAIQTPFIKEKVLIKDNITPSWFLIIMMEV